MAKSSELQARLDTQVKKYPNSPFTKYIQGRGDKAFAAENAKVMAEWEHAYPVSQQDKATEQAAIATTALNDNRSAMLEMQKQSTLLGINNNAELGADSTAANIVAGGTAAEGSNDATTKKKRGARGTGMATQLGINV